VVRLQLFLNVAVFLVDSLFLLVPLLDLLIGSSLDLLLEGSQLDGLLGPKGVQCGFYLLVPGAEPGVLLGLLEFRESLLDLVGLDVPK